MYHLPDANKYYLNVELYIMIDVTERARFVWHCRRGMLELDLILQRFMKHSFDELSAEEIRKFDALLSCTDPELFAWFMGHESPEDNELLEIVTIIRNKNHFR